LPKYKIFRYGKFEKEVDNILGDELWNDSMVSFIIGCSFSFEEELVEAGLEIRHLKEGKNVPMYKTNIKC
jgi:uncharacterized protein YcsI (UPF0317 family)